MRNREQRTTVRLTARMRVGSEWSDVAIHNVSAHGMLLQTDVPPRPGSYIEIRRAAVLIIARAIWVRDRLFGVRAQDIIDLGELTHARPVPSRTSIDGGYVERRHAHRTAATRQRSQAIARHFQFVLTGAVAAIAAVLVAYTVLQGLSQPFDQVRQALSGNQAETAAFDRAANDLRSF